MVCLVWLTRAHTEPQGGPTYQQAATQGGHCMYRLHNRARPHPHTPRRHRQWKAAALGGDSDRQPSARRENPRSPTQCYDTLTALSGGGGHSIEAERLAQGARAGAAASMVPGVGGLVNGGPDIAWRHGRSTLMKQTRGRLWLTHVKGHSGRTWNDGSLTA